MQLPLNKKIWLEKIDELVNKKDLNEREENL